MANAQTFLDYRRSHVASGKPAAYHASFHDDPWRAFLWRREQQILDAILARWFPDRSPVHLDLACGTGRILGHLLGRAAGSVGVDISPAMLAKARQVLPHARLVLGDITSPSMLPGQTFDLITAFRFFANAQPELKLGALANAVTHLNTGGIIVFNNHRPGSASLYRLARLLGKQPATMSLQETCGLIRTCGLEAAELWPVGVLPATDGHMLAPPALHRLADSVACIAGVGKHLAQDLIFVCRRAPHAANSPASTGHKP